MSGDDVVMKAPRRKPNATPRKPPRPSAPREKTDEEADERIDDGARLRLRRLNANRYALLPPFTAVDRAEDIGEVRTMIAAGELEIARDELLYLVGDCRGFLEAHNLLGELALEEEDISLARGHFGFAYEVGLDSLPPGFKGHLPANFEYNGAFFLAGRGLARCLIARGEARQGREVLEQLSRFDPRNKEVLALLAELAERDAKP
jgi:hypothetical protein